MVRPKYSLTIKYPVFRTDRTQLMLEFITSLADFVNAADDFIWGIPMLVMLLGIGILLTLNLKVLQVFHLPEALRLLFTPHRDHHSKQGEVTSFAALCTALAATIGTGNIVGVATAVGIGGPGALFWMFVAAFFGMATKYAECLLAVKFREQDSRGHFVGGPMFYIKNGIGPRHAKTAKVLAVLFAVFGVVAACLGIGTYTQINSVVEAANQLHCDRLWVTVIITILTIIITYGGLRTISKTAQKVVPVMGLVYILTCIAVIVLNIGKVPDAVMLILESAFSTAPAVGGFAGATIMMAMQKGVARGIFSNEAGLGSAPIAAASAKTNSPVEQGLISMTGTFIDTIIICMLTGLTLVITGAWCSDQTGVAMTTLAFQGTLGNEIGLYVVNISLMLFAFTTIIGWNFYAERCIIYLFGVKGVKPFRSLYILIVASYILIVLYVDMNNVADKTAINTIWTIADLANGLMAIPNLIALFMLRKVIFSETKAFFTGKKGNGVSTVEKA